MVKGNNFLNSAIKNTGKKLREASLVRTFVANFPGLVEHIKSDSNLLSRIIISAILVPVVIFAVYSSNHVFFHSLILISVVVMSFEWANLVSIKKGETSFNENFWIGLGIAYIMVPFLSIIIIKYADRGASVLFWLLLIIWATDIAAFVCGKVIGGPKILPSVSPNKTWSGLFGGVIASSVIGLIFGIIFDGMMFFIFISMILSVLSQVGDFCESKIKRYFGVKDTGKILMGHGGIMDRIDGLTFVMPMGLLILIVFKSHFVQV